MIVSASRLTTTDSVVASAGADYIEARSDLAAVCADRVVISNYKRHDEGVVQACRLCSNNIVGLLCGKVEEEGE
jgi:hypothetical protein